MKHKINLLQFCTCFYMLMISPFLGMGIYNLLKEANIDSTISILISFILGFIFLYIFITVFNYKPEYNLKDKIFSLFNKYISIIIIFILCITIFILGNSISYGINSFIISQFLSETPMLIFGIVMGLLIIYINSKGIEVISRVSTIFFIINIILMLITILGQYDKLDMNNLKPVLASGLYKPTVGAIYIILLNIVFGFISLIIPKNTIVNNSNTTKYIIISYIFTFLCFTLATVITIGSLGINLATIYQYPAYIVLKGITLFNFLDRIENIIIIQWLFQVFISISLITYFINKMTGIKVYIIVIINIIFYELFYKSNTFFNYFTNKYIPIFSIIILFIMIILFIKIKTDKN